MQVPKVVRVKVRQMPARWTEAGQAALRTAGREEGKYLVVPRAAFEAAERKPPRPPEEIPEGYAAEDWQRGRCCS